MVAAQLCQLRGSEALHGSGTLSFKCGRLAHVHGKVASGIAQDSLQLLTAGLKELQNGPRLALRDSEVTGATHREKASSLDPMQRAQARPRSICCR